MKKYSPKSISRFLFSVFLTFLTFTSIIIIASFFLNNFLAAQKNTIEQNLSHFINQKISIEGTLFLPPHFIILKNVAISETNQSVERQPVFIERVKCTLSLPMLIIKRDFAIVNIYLDKPNINYLFIKENFEEILEAFNSLDQKEPLRIGLKRARLNMPQKTKPTRWLTADATLTINPDKSILSSGSINLNGLFIKDKFKKGNLIPEVTSLCYNFHIVSTKDGLIIENLDFKSSQFYTKLWGKLKKNILITNGFLCFGGALKNNISSQNFYILIDRLKRLLLFRGKAFPPTIMGLSGDVFNIYDLACVAKLSFPSIDIENLSFTLKNIPFCLKGVISLSESPALNLTFSSFVNQPQHLRFNNPKAFDINMTGNLQERKFNGAAIINFLRKTKGGHSWEKVETTFENLTVSDGFDTDIMLSLKGMDLTYASGDNLYNIFLKDFTAFVNLENKKIKFVKLNAKLADGFLDGMGVLDISRIPLRSSFDINIKDVEVGSLPGLLLYCSKIYGNFSSQIDYRNYPALELSGKLEIKDGLLDNLIFFKWAADFLKVPSLKQINFDTLSAEFSVTNENVSLHRICLNSKEVSIKGYFTLYENDLVSSRLSLGLSKKLLRDSPKLSPLINYLDKDVPSVSFNFQLSGLSQAMNFKWLESDFKEGLMDLLPSWMERGIEAKIEKIIETLPTLILDGLN
ncbi:MAG: AsmA family protein [Candidatus Omnitrophica bacterium]|nr:AsmA family protein [Candidatus Omnitrophota bacterium]